MVEAQDGPEDEVRCRSLLEGAASSTEPRGYCSFGVSARHMTGTAEVAAGAIAVAGTVDNVALHPRVVVHLVGWGVVFAAREDSSRRLAVYWARVCAQPASALPALARHACRTISNIVGLVVVGSWTYAGKASGLKGRLYAAILSRLAAGGSDLPCGTAFGG